MAVVPEAIGTPRADAEDQLRRSLNSFHYLVTQKFPKYSVFTSDARESTSPTEISEATMKIYLKGSSGEREYYALTKLRDIFEDSLPVAFLITSYISEGHRIVFVKHLEKSLADEIGDRSRIAHYWSEVELWEHMWSITRAIFQVHFVGLVHRNITPDSLFLKKGKLYLFHFEHSRELARGESVLPATTSVTGSYLSPQGMRATSSHADQTIEYTYNVARKDDVWGLGRTLLDMVTLRQNTDLRGYYHLPQEEFSKYISALIGTRYSTLLQDAITKLLALNDCNRPSFQDFYDDMQEFYRIGYCLDCHQRTVALWPCEHIRCERCLEQALIRLVLSGSDKIRLCPSHTSDGTLSPSATDHFVRTCSDETPPVCFEKYRKVQKLATLILSPMQQCHRCAQRYTVLSQNRAPKFITCACGAQFCSFCKSTTGHNLLGVMRMCPSFADLMRS